MKLTKNLGKKSPKKKRKRSEGEDEDKEDGDRARLPLAQYILSKNDKKKILCETLKGAKFLMVIVLTSKILFQWMIAVF